jgi:uncharacterized membrane protein YeiH
VIFPNDKVLEIVSQIACIAIVFVIRVLATKLKWNLPKAIIFAEMKEEEQDKSEEPLLK